jgi:hypothetical protein
VEPDISNEPVMVVEEFLKTVVPIIVVEPLILTLPVNDVVPVKILLPIWVVEPLIFKLPVKKLLPNVKIDPVVIKLPEVNIEPENIKVSTLAENIVPVEPLMATDPVMLAPLAILTEFRLASEPDTMTFFQLGIVNVLLLWLDTYTYAVYMPTSLAGLQYVYI